MKSILATRIRALPRAATLLAGAAVVYATAACALASDAISIERLMADKKQGRFAAYAANKTPLKVEGRYSNFSSRLLRFLKCEDLNFIWYDEDSVFPLNPASLRSRTIEVYGRLEPRGDKVVFLVEHVRELPSDAESVRVRKAALRDAPAADWYKLGDDAMHRAAYYGDSDLEADARAIYAEAVERERRGLAGDAVDAKLALSRKFTAYGLPDEDRVEFLHETFCLRWLALKDKSPKELDALSERTSARLAGCRTPHAEGFDPLRERYLREPLAVYKSATRAERRRLNRVLFAEMRFGVLQAWERDQHPDGLVLADRIDREVPEFHARAEAIREKALDEKLAAVVTQSRDDMLRLAETFLSRGEPNKALRAKTTWVHAREERLLKEQRPEDLVQIAHDYLRILDDKDRAAGFLKKALELAPALKDAAAELELLGFKQVGGRWMTNAEAAALPVDPARRAAESGRYIGMTRDQVRKALSSNPDSVTRIVSAGRISEVWIYEKSAKSRLAIHFAGSTDGHDVKVVRLAQ